MPNTRHIHTARSLCWLALLLYAGCVLGPSDGASVADRSASIGFYGYAPEANASVQVRAWNFQTHRVEDVGPLAHASPNALDPRYFDDPTFEWSAPRALPNAYWRAGPNGGYCARIGARIQAYGAWQSAITVDSDWGSCYQRHRDNSFYTACAGQSSPEARIYTRAWSALPISNAALALASVLAGRRLQIVIDNYTPTANEYCSADHLANCPADWKGVPQALVPETFKYYRPNASRLSADGAEVRFSINPERRDPHTIYVDDIASRSVALSVVGNRLRLAISFETDGPEVRMNCIRNAQCFISDGTTIDVNSLSATLDFALQLDGDAVGYSDVSVQVSASGDGRASLMADALRDNFADKLNHDAAVRHAVGSGLTGLLREMSGLDAAYPIAGIEVRDNAISVRPGCPRD